ncbi:MgtC/SapB family protein [Treponema phagedenis]|nr:MgtC/SapB family protein [Treponema phagedenis]QEJ96439.1 MgtC/SapB family protein [Treponema phagedenis]QEJ99596.1 MgtC/SapB family protein [Treponema phagedenis]QEK02221.1 MgtC/SapB family protein [Treponema phagedenis]QEK05147.1 MgtC/SapB family protein [Treponema phagedenis]
MRIMFAVLCGTLIGYEREHSLKAAGLRTHIIVAAASCLMMTISKYGFYDVLQTKGIDLDPSRVAAAIVSGVGFLGAGTIFMRKKSITGLTTAAGVWATAGIGMAMATGMYIEGFFTTIVVFIAQIISHSRFYHGRFNTIRSISLKVNAEAEIIQFILTTCAEHNISLLRFKVHCDDSAVYTLKLLCKIPQNIKISPFIESLRKNTDIISIHG